MSKLMAQLDENLMVVNIVNAQRSTQDTDTLITIRDDQNAGIGFTFDPDRGINGEFIPPKPYDSWLLDEETFLWIAPVAYPENSGAYNWDESTQSWIEMV